MRGLWIGVGVAVLAGLILMPSGAAASAARHEKTFEIPPVTDVFINADSSHGYKLALWAHQFFPPPKEQSEPDATVLLTAQRGGAKAIYIPPAKVSANALRARLGELGAIAVRFDPRAVQMSKPGQGCRGKEVVTEHGVFKGKFRFRGEGGYTSFDAERLRGTVIRYPKRTCRLPVPSVHEQGSTRVGGTTHHGHSYVAFSARRLPAQLVTEFFAWTSERRGKITIERSVTSKGSADAFVSDQALTNATVEPSAPFQGRASFQAFAGKSTGTWLGSLAVSFPGRPHVRLAGKAFDGSLLTGTQCSPNPEIVCIGTS